MEKICHVSRVHAIIYLRSFAIYNIYFSLPSFSLCQSLEQHREIWKNNNYHNMSCFNCIHDLVMNLFSIIYSPITRVHRQLVSTPRKRTMFHNGGKRGRVIRFLSEGGKRSVILSRRNGRLQEIGYNKASSPVVPPSVRCFIQSMSRCKERREPIVGGWNEHGTIYAISSDFGDRMTTQHLN